MKIIGLKAENIKRLIAVEIHPSGNLVTLGGRNGHGKTSILDAITMALGGAQAIPSKPLRDGCIAGEVVLDLGEIVVSRTFDEKGGTKLEVRNQKGGKLPSPQGILDALVGKLACDPVAFLRMDRHKQLETLKRLVGLDFTDLDAKHAAVEEDRKIVGRDGTALKARRELMPFHPGVPDAEVSATDILADVEAGRQVNRTIASLDEGIEMLDLNADAIRKKVRAIRAGAFQTDEIQQKTQNLVGVKAEHALNVTIIREINNQIEELRERLERCEEKDARLYESINKEQFELTELIEQTAVSFDKDADLAVSGSIVKREARAQLQTVDIEPLLERVRGVEATNAKVRDNRAQREAVAQIEQARAKWDELTAVLTAIDESKRTQMAAVEFPVGGLSFDAHQVLYNGLPFGQASAAEQLRISMAMAIKMNPRLRVVLVRDASILDDDSMALVAKMAADHDVQVWVEIVTKDPSECAVFIEDGEVRV